MFRYSALFLLAGIFAACAPMMPLPQLTATPFATLTATSSSTLTPTSTPTPPSPIPLPIAADTNLVVRVYQISKPVIDPISFTTIQGEQFTRPKIIALSRSDYFPDNSYFEEMTFSMWIELGGEKLIAAEYESDNCQNNWVNVTRNGVEIYRIEVGKCSPITALRNLFTVDGHWVLETNYYSADTFSHGNITLDGVLLNDQFAYEDAFGAQTIAGELFYFFQQDGMIQAWYNGQDILLNYEEIPHYSCCSAAELNPLSWMDMVAFFGVRDGIWYFNQIGTSDSFAT